MSVDAVLDCARLARGSGATGAQLLGVAANATGAATIEQALEQLARRAAALAAIEAETPSPPRGLAELSPAVAAEPWPARMRLDVGDHEIRGKLLFADLLGRRSFFQVAAWSIAGVALDARDAELLEQLGVLTQLADPRIWPLTVTRTVAARGGTLGACVAAGIGALCTRLMTAEPVRAFADFLAEVDEAERRGQSVATTLDSVIRGRRRLLGVGRPVLKADERVPHALALVERFGAAQRRSFTLAREIDGHLRAHKGLAVNSAGFAAAIMRDLGFTSRAAAAFTLLFFIVPVLTHAADATPHPA